MSTRCFIGRISDGKGRYVHCDGYPTYMVEEIARIFKRDGYDKMMKTIVDDNRQWSCIDSNMSSEVPSDPVAALYYEIVNGTNDDRFSVVDGYGRVNRDNDENNEYWTVNDVAGELDYGYLIGEDGTVRVYIYPDKYTEFNVNKYNQYTSQDVEHWVESNL